MIVSNWLYRLGRFAARRRHLVVAGWIPTGIGGSDTTNSNGNELPTGLQLTRTTPTFDQESVPKGLLAAHRVAEGVWGRLIVHTGALTFCFEDEPDNQRRVSAGEHVVIPPNRPHHLELDSHVTFAVEFHRPDHG